jgi:NAD(P)-dependent dehydrogenase (short-subunit alcohol dehydrogenase family)
MKIVVIGGTGLIGSKTVAILRQGGHEVLAATPNTGVNTITGEGLKEATAGAQVVIDPHRHLPKTGREPEFRGVPPPGAEYSVRRGTRTCLDQNRRYQTQAGRDFFSRRRGI